MELISLAFILFLFIDPIGNIVPFRTVLEGTESSKRPMLIIREMFFALGLMLLFYFIGDFLMDALSVSEITVNLSVGIILFLFALKILYPSADHIRQKLKPSSNPFFVPLALPLIASPSLLATIMLYAHVDILWGAVFIAILIAWACSMVILLLGNQLYKILGSNGLMACERLMGMILILLAIQRFLEGIRLFVHTT